MVSGACTIRVIWDREAFPMGAIRYTDTEGEHHSIRFHPVYVNPETEYPAGRKGLALAGAWQQLGVKGGADGMLVLDGDVAIDPLHVVQMLAAISSDPEIVHTAAVKIWPVSTNRNSWHWAHWEKEPSQQIDEIANWFSFNFTYLPKKLIEICLKNGLRNWTYPNCDACVCKEARKAGIPARVVPDCYPVHMHW